MSFDKLVEEMIKEYGRKDGKIQLQREMIDCLMSAQNALKFYAEESNYDSPIYDEYGHYNGSEVDKDSGAMARVALELE